MHKIKHFEIVIFGTTNVVLRTIFLMQYNHAVFNASFVHALSCSKLQGLPGKHMQLAIQKTAAGKLSLHFGTIISKFPMYPVEFN